MAAGAVLNLSGQNPAFPPAGANVSKHFFDCVVELDSLDVDHADDAILVFQFPSVAWIQNVSGEFGAAVLTDAELDTNATETLEIDLAIGGVDGVADYLLDTGASATWAEVGGAVESAIIATAGTPTWIDVSDLYLQLIVRTVSATPADGDVYISGAYSQNLVRATFTSTNL